MMNTIEEFIAIWIAEADKTEQILKAIDDKALHTRLIPDYRTMGQLIWHILETPREMLERTELHVAGPDFNSKPATTIKAMIEEHKRVVDSVAKEIHENWVNSTLKKVDNMYGESWSRSATLSSIVSHLIHHRGQLTVLMRLAKLKVPGIYGPAKEEWAAIGMTAPVL